MANPKRGEVWTVDLSPTRGHEQAGKRPALVLSANLFNQGPAGLAVVLPSVAKGIPFHAAVAPPEGGLRALSFVKCEDIRSFALERFSRRWGTVHFATMTAVENRIRILLEL